MTKKHFIAIAKVLKHLQETSTPTEAASILHSKVTQELALLFGSWNANFDRDRFIKAATGLDSLPWIPSVTQDKKKAV